MALRRQFSTLRPPPEASGPPLRPRPAPGNDGQAASDRVNYGAGGIGEGKGIIGEQARYDVCLLYAGCSGPQSGGRCATLPVQRVAEG